eukprot:GHVO01029231.1.p1 GENE.GHVO01029231.1~~GHVO01029231.1.p1  ORF type:complete len:629 (+),score=97.78 GHVO01029231.1:876-2762(+)
MNSTYITPTELQCDTSPKSKSHQWMTTKTRRRIRPQCCFFWGGGDVRVPYKLIIMDEPNHTNPRRLKRPKKSDYKDSLKKSVAFTQGVLIGASRIPEWGGIQVPKLPPSTLTHMEGRETMELGPVHVPLKATLPYDYPGHCMSQSSSMETISNPAHGPTIDRLTLLTFNAGLLEYKLCGINMYANPPFAKHRVLHIPVAIRASEADIVALQEVYDEQKTDYIVNTLRLTLPFVGRRASGNCMTLHNGLLVLSKFPIVDTKFHPFQKVTAIERIFGSKGMLEVRIEIPGMGVVTVINCHLASGAVDPESEAMENLRNEEVQQLLDLADVIHDRGDTPIILGDLNAAPNTCSSNYNAFIKNGWRDVYIHSTMKQEERKRVETAPTEVASTSSAQDVYIDRPTGDVLPMEYYEEAVHAMMHNDSDSDPADISTINPPSTSDDGERCTTHLLGQQERTDVEEDPADFQGPRKAKAFFSNLMGSFSGDASARYLSDVDIRLEARRLASEFIASHTPQWLRSQDDDVDEEMEFGSNSRIIQRVMDSTRHIVTWDPDNPLNTIGPHAGCHGQRCDHILLPPLSQARGLGRLEPRESHIIFKEPRVVVDGNCFGLLGKSMIVTLSDHYGLKTVLGA